jgi:hypothetical protein
MPLPVGIFENQQPCSLQDCFFMIFNNVSFDSSEKVSFPASIRHLVLSAVESLSLIAFRKIIININLSLSLPKAYHRIISGNFSSINEEHEFGWLKYYFSDRQINK